MNIYLIKKPSGEVLATNRTITGLAMELYGLDVVSVGGVPANKDAFERELESKSAIECQTSEGETLIVERHYLSN